MNKQKIKLKQKYNILIKNDNFKNVQDAVGIDAKYWADKKILD